VALLRALGFAAAPAVGLGRLPPDRGDRQRTQAPRRQTAAVADPSLADGVMPEPSDPAVSRAGRR